MFEIFLTWEGITGLLTLTLLEIVLGIDNIVFISILSNKVEPKHVNRVRNIGIILALAVRIALLFMITWIIGMKADLFHVFGQGITGRDLILIGGGLFLMYKSTTEIHDKVTGYEHEDESKKKFSTPQKIIIQIILIDVVFSFDSILTAVGLSGDIVIMIAAVVISMLVMLAFAKGIANFINERPTIKMIALSFLLMIGLLLVLEGVEVEVPKGYIYFAMAYSLGVEFLNLKMRKNRKKP
jgi:predicted tellurium resistance membrane protein TerC